MFLKFALGRREEKSESDIMSELHHKKYDPRADPLMSRLFRKANHQMSTLERPSMNTPGSIFSTHNHDSISRMNKANYNSGAPPSKKVSLYDNNESVVGKDRYTLV